jgi:RsiW-degrading membrane proteinase PrsW (M82 family)
LFFGGDGLGGAYQYRRPLFGIVLPLEKFALQYLSGPQLLFSWACIEELTKFAAAFFIALRARVFDEPLDAVIYMVTVALGFSAAENTLFLMNPLIRAISCRR